MNPNDQSEEQKRKKGAVDYANEGINKGRDAYNAYQKVQGVVRAARGAQAAAEGVQAAAAAASTVEVWAPILIIILLLLLIVTVVVIIFGGGAQANAAPTCQTISSSSNTATPARPVILTLDNCSASAIFSWSSNTSTGTFSPTNEQSTNFTPGAITVNTPVTITANVCNANSANSCTQYTIVINAEPATCKALNGACTSAQLCGVEGSGTITGATDCSTTQVCCSFNTAKYFCEYGAVNSSGNITDPGAWNYTYNNGKFCSISSGRFNGNFIGAKGCAPSAIAMALSSLGYPINPKQVSQQNPSSDLPSRNIGCQDPGTSSTDMSNGVRKWVNNLPGTYSMTGDLIPGAMTVGVLNTFSTYLSKGCYIVGGAYLNTAQNSGWTGFIGHAFLITDVDVAARTVTTLDPTFCEGPGRNTGGKRTLVNVTTKSTATNNSVNGWFNAFAICR